MIMEAFEAMQTAEKIHNDQSESGQQLKYVLALIEETANKGYFSCEYGGKIYQYTVDQLEKKGYTVMQYLINDGYVKKLVRIEIKW